MQRAFSLAFLIVLFVISSIAFCLAQKPNRSNSDQENSLRIFLRDYLKSSPDYATTRYVSTFVNLQDAKAKDAIVYFTDQDSCGSGGCTTLILAPSGTSYKVVTSITIGWPPIRVLASKSNGWHDIGVWVQGGGIQPGYEAILSFDGVSYPTNPSVSPAKRAASNTQGRIVIPVAAPGKPLN
jgi:hypothetical protein